MFDLSAQPWCNQRVLHVNRLKPRAFFQTSTDEEKALAGDFDRVHSLNGKWDFCYFDATPLDEQAFIKTLDTLSWSAIDVPRSFQMAGYGPLLYTDEDYPFPIQPPLVPAQNPTGVYRRFFEIDGSADARILRMEGVESCASVYVNGQFAGYTQGSRLPAEFDITSLCHPGSNELLILIRQYCDGVYLEDQDMWWLGGVIRDVLLLNRPENRIEDIRIQADYEAETGLGTLSIYVPGSKARCRLMDAGENTVWEGMSGEGHTFPVTPWNAEEPYLYTLLVAYPKECARLRVGFRRVEITAGELRLNGRRLMLRGVNRHEFSPVNGRAVTREETRKDLLMMKQIHLNAIRTSHYPNNPFFYELCDELGLYVMDECDLETHGFEIEGTPSRLANDPMWRQAYLDRAERTFHRDCNFTCVIMWSLANESFRGENLHAMYDYFHHEDTRPVHYEGDIAYTHSDVISTMYSPIGRLMERDASDPDKPMLLCEFAHAMGNGPGSLKEYRQAIEQSRHIQGYFIWEWRNHGILRDGRYLHGGDAGSVYHSSNFCMDGLLNSDCTPTPGFYSFAKMNEPLRISLQGTQLSVTSTFTFRTVRDARIHAELRREDQIIETWSITLPPLPSGETISILLPETLASAPENALYSLSVTVQDENAHSFGQESFVLREYVPQYQKEQGIAWERQGDCLKLTDGAFSYQISLSDGRLYHYCVNGEERLSAGPQLSLYRPAMDNDKYRRERWCDLHLHAMTPVIERAQLEEDTLILTGRLGAKARLWSVPFTLRYTPLPEGRLRIQLNWYFDGPFGEGRNDYLPRVGTDSVVPKQFDQMAYLGYGPGETYCDSKFHARYGWYTVPVRDLAFAYDCPQESGNRTGCKVSALLGADGAGIAYVSQIPCDTAASFYCAGDIDHASHPDELNERDAITWRMDWKEAGLGSGSCGPEQLEAYTVRALPFHMDFVLMPVSQAKLVCIAQKGWDSLC